ncbi:hypothetical protein NW768_008594 [Fusarium equiseti]|uniref:Uncharacterized protein n=1 Tax=Fusarium equiseti TaxID=61235 RepID=A0ABQ8R4H3_FUSEQ|nr:hypothetical protein NW768_008594 [Fusarium equiseti]
MSNSVCTFWGHVKTLCVSAKKPIKNVSTFFKSTTINIIKMPRRCPGSSDDHEYDPARPPAGSHEEIEWEIEYHLREALAYDAAARREQRLLDAANMAIILWQWIANFSEAQ